MEPLFYQSISKLSHALNTKQLSAVELLQAFFERIDAVEDKVQAFISLDREKSLLQAKASDERRSQGKLLGPLDGIPVGIKDIIAEKDQPQTCGSKILEHYRSPYDATVIEKLKNAGAVLVGRLNMDEFAMGSSTESSAYHKTYNPWNLDYIPGGSSGGSAGAVASGEVPLSLGSDTGGSIRQPAGCCGIYGLKPTYGLVSRYGLSSLASSTDQIGPFARNIEDLALLLQVIAGHDDRDSTSAPQSIPDYSQAFQEDKPCKIGIPKEYFGEGLDSEVRQSIEQVIQFYKERGYGIVDISLPHTQYVIPTYYVIMTAEASSNLAKFDGVRYTRRGSDVHNAVDLYFRSREEGLGPEVKRRILLGTYVLSSDHQDAYYIRAQKVRTLIKQDFVEAFKKVDVILTPTMPTTAFKIGEKLNDPLQMYLSDLYTVAASLAGLPEVAIPCGFSSQKLPIGFQLTGNYFCESIILSVAQLFEQAHNYHLEFPNL